jgi:hypothetical protein
MAQSLNGKKIPKIECTNKMSKMTFAIAVSIAIVISISLGVINYSLNISPFSDTVAECEKKTLEYMQKGYYTGGALQFNAAISYCSK